jgi:aromatic ring hydroxylase
MAATARLVVQMTPAEKKALDAKAKRAGLPVSEFVRRRLSADDLDQQREEIEALLAGLEARAPDILSAIDAAMATAAAVSARLDALSAEARK